MNSTMCPPTPNDRTKPAETVSQKKALLPQVVSVKNCGHREQKLIDMRIKGPEAIPENA